jgi:Flp pilus assembly protein TadB
LVRTRKNRFAIFTKAFKKLTLRKRYLVRIYCFMKPHSNNKAKFKGKKAPLFFAFLYLLLCFVSIFSIDPVLWFLKYAALFGVLTAVLLIAYIIRTDEL